jgi:predicted membrane protein
MDFMFSKIFWGFVVIVLGISIILNAVFKVHFPFFKTILALFLIYVGVKILFGAFRPGYRTGEKEAVFSESSFNPVTLKDGEKFETVFGSQRVDLRNVTLSPGITAIDVNCVFGSQMILLPSGVNIRVRGSSVFGSIKFPNGDQLSFGDRKFDEGREAALPTLMIDSDCVFGSINISR